MYSMTAAGLFTLDQSASQVFLLLIHTKSGPQLKPDIVLWQGVSCNFDTELCTSL